MAYVTLGLNHHRLCQSQATTMLPLQLTELWQATRQIGAFQVRVQRALAQVLLTTLQGSQFWTQWGGWVLDQLQGWHEGPPPLCLTPGLLPLATGPWSWREQIVIQAMALEAGLSLVETLPLDAEALEILLGLREALVTDTSVADLRGFERVPLGLPVLPQQLGQVDWTPPAGRAETLLPPLVVRLSAQGPLAVTPAMVVRRWLWAVAQQIGLRSAYVGLWLSVQLGDATQPLTVTGETLLAQMQGLALSPREADLQGLARRVRRLALAQVQVEDWQLLDRQRVARVEWLWQLSNLVLIQDLDWAGTGYDVGPARSLTFDWTLGPWLQRLGQVYGAAGRQALLDLAAAGRPLLNLNPGTQRLALKVSLFWLDRGTQEDWTLGTLLTAVEPTESLRRPGLWRLWQTAVQDLQTVGWWVQGQPQAEPMGPEGWNTPVSITVGPRPPQASSQPAPEPRPERRRMDPISRRALVQALTRRGMSQATLARALQLDRSTINRWVNGSRSIHPRYRPALWSLLGPDLR